jgi:hypothetical protein
MSRWILALVFIGICAEQPGLAQQFKVWDHTVQIHGFLFQGSVKTDTNNWLTMETRGGSSAMTEMGLNASSQLTDKLRVGAQVYDRNLGQLGQFHPSLDWGLVDYRFTQWFGVRAGKVKTPLGLFNDSQDVDFLRAFALLPQGVYPTDLRDMTIAHKGIDIYGTIPLRHRMGEISYTGYAGFRSDSLYSGYPYLMREYWINLQSLKGRQYGADLRWNLPIPGLMVGASRMNQCITGRGSFVNLLDPTAGPVPFRSTMKPYWTNQFYGEYIVRRLRLDAEYRRDFFSSPYFPGVYEQTYAHSWYLAGSYRIVKHFEVGTYYSHFVVKNTGSPELAAMIGPMDPSLPQNHIYDKVIAGHLDVNRYLYFKVEGHFMDGYGWATFPNGFYPQQNLDGFASNTNAAVIKTGFHF